MADSFGRLVIGIEIIERDVSERVDNLLHQQKRRVAFAEFNSVDGPSRHAAFLGQIVLRKACGNSRARDPGSLHASKVGMTPTEGQALKLAGRPTTCALHSANILAW